MKNYLLFFPIILLSIIATAQNDKALLLNINAHRSSYPMYDNPFRQQYAFPSFEFQKRNKKRAISFELAKVSLKFKDVEPIDHPDVQYKYRYGNFSGIVRTQYQRFINLKNSNWQPFIGGALSFHFIRNTKIPRVSTDFPRIVTSAGFDQHISLGTYYHISNKYFLQFNGLFGIGRESIIHSNVANPALVQSAQRKSDIDIFLLPDDYLFRIGIGKKL